MNTCILSRSIILLTVCCLISSEVAYTQSKQKSRSDYLKESLLINEPRDHRHAISLRVSSQDSTWLEWQQRTGELPPDFNRMLSVSHLPEPLQMDGSAITSNHAWEQKKEWIRDQYQYWVSGYRPPAPDSIRSVMLEERVENGVRIQLIELNFGPSFQAKMTFELMIPPGNGPFPVYMTQWNHRNWAQLALRRGYMTCVYAGADQKDDTQAYQQLYPDYDFTCLMRRAWGASRVVDYLYTRQETNREKIAITGHSRNGKQSLWAAAFDERFTAVITSSCGTGGVTPFRYTDPQYCTQTIDDITSNAAHWFHPRLRFFFGREDRLPVDQNLLLSLIAPRSLLIHYAVVERQLSPWATEQCYRSARKVYSFLGAEEHIAIFPRMGEHAVATRDLERCIDFLDIRFKLRDGPWDNKLYYTYDFDEWYTKHKNKIHSIQIEPEFLTVHKTVASFEKQKTEILGKLNHLLGKEPAGIASVDVQITDPSRLDWIDLITGRPQLSDVFNFRVGPYTAMNDHLSGYIYCPDTTGKSNIPLIIYLHPYAHAHGSAYGYASFNSDNNRDLFRKFTDNGFAVLTLDLPGFGARMEEGVYFYDRFPDWSLMGRMIADVKSCLDAVSFFPFLDKENVFVVGNTLGGSVALLSAALDSRINGVAVVSAFSPWRDKQSTYFLTNFSHKYGLIPQLGMWQDKPADVPVDFTEIMASIAPRPLLVIAPQLDRHVNNMLVKKSVTEAGAIFSLYGKKEHLLLEEPLEINRLTRTMGDDIVEFLKEHI